MRYVCEPNDMGVGGQGTICVSETERSKDNSKHQFEWKNGSNNQNKIIRREHFTFKQKPDI